MALTVQSVLNGAMTNPEVAVGGAAIGFVLGYLYCKRNMGNSMGMGGK